VVEGDPGAARRQLETVAAAGPVPVIAWQTPQAIAPEMVAAALARGVRGLDVRFVPHHRVQPNSVAVSFAKVSPERLCRGDVDGLAEPMVLLVWCGRDGAVAAVELPLPSMAPSDVERSLWRGASRLFPDDYADRYGLDLFGLRVGMGASIGF
jgi:hypothetical protein